MDKQAQLDELYREYIDIPVLLPLSDGRKKALVRGHGPLDAPLVVVGEAPGREEEEQGRPFVGPSGQLLQRMFEKAQIPWQLCYVMNVVPWRPENNRTPYPFEVMASWKRVEQEIAIVAPRVVVVVGATSWFGVTRDQHGWYGQFRYKWLTNSDSGLGYDVMTIHHPAWIMRQSKLIRDEYEAKVTEALRSMFGESYDDGER